MCKKWCLAMSEAKITEFLYCPAVITPVIGGNISFNLESRAYK
jgi:hypothetical protein